MNKRCFIFFLLLACGSGSLRAQNQEPLASATFKQRLRGQYLTNDTVQAIINLYSKRQLGGAEWILAAGLSAARIASSPDRTTVNGTVVRESSNAGAAFLFALPIAGYGAAKIAHYSNGHLERILTDYAGGRPLARSLRRKLKPRFFELSAEYKRLNVRPVK